VRFGLVCRVVCYSILEDGRDVPAYLIKAVVISLNHMQGVNRLVRVRESKEERREQRKPIDQVLHTKRSHLSTLP
jgi:hypothetical protein